MAEYRWTGRHAYHDHANGRVIESGDELPAGIAERVAEAHPQEVDEIETEDVSIEDPPFDPAECTVDELRDALADMPEGVSDAHLAALAEAEREGKARDSAVEAIEAARSD